MKTKKIVAVVLTVIMMVGLFAGCGNSKGEAAGDNGAATNGTTESANTADVKTNHYKIGVGLYTDTGKAVEAIKAYLEGISKDIDCEFTYVTLSTYDEATNLSAIQNLISSGCNGIILTADMGTTAIVKECQAANVYLAGFLCDYNMSYNTAHDEVFGNEYFLGSVADGKRDQSAYGTAVAEKVIEAGLKNIGVLVFPAYAYPNQALVDEAFRAKIAEYNETAGDADKINLVDTQELNFAPLEDTYLSDHSDIDGLFSIAAGSGMVYPVLVANNRTDIKLYTTGFEGTDDADNFGTAGNQCYQSTMFSAPEAIVYPLCLLIDKLNGTTYADLPAEPEVVDCSPEIILSDDDLAKVKTNLYYTGKYEDSFINGADVVKLCASYNADATYANLVDTINHMGVEDIK